MPPRSPSANQVPVVLCKPPTRRRAAAPFPSVGRPDEDFWIPAKAGMTVMRNLPNLLVHLFGRNDDLDGVYLSALHDRCLLCEEEISRSDAYLTHRVCPYCRFHYTLSARQRIQLLADRRSFKESHKFVRSVAPLTFSSRGPYQELLNQDQNRTGLTEAAVIGRCRIESTEVVLVVLDFGFMGGSMGSVVGEKVALALETATKRELPVVAIVTGGGARLQEGILSLMQMAKTVTAANRLREKHLPFIAVLANPSTGQAYASFANLADVILAEPGALIGLSPLRALREVSEHPLPTDAHTAEAHLGHGLLDGVVDREELRDRLATLLRVLTRQKTEDGPGDLLRAQLPAPGDPEAWAAVRHARHPERPAATAYIRAILDQFVELHGDRLKSDDRTVIAGVGYLAGEPVAVIGQQRPPPADGERSHTFPDGLRKAQRIIGVANRFGLPLMTLIDTQGADPGLQSEEEGIGSAIANTLSLMAGIPNPVVSVIIGEGGSEGALALGLSDRVLMQENAIYSPVSLNHNLGGPYPNPALNREAAETLMLTAPDCLELGIIDAVVPEPEQGAHADYREAAQLLKTALVQEFARLSRQPTAKLLRERYRKFRRMGELSSHSHEAMTREIEQLMNLSARRPASLPQPEEDAHADVPIPLSD